MRTAALVMTVLEAAFRSEKIGYKTQGSIMNNQQLMRPKVEKGKSILDQHYEEIKNLLDIGVSIPSIRLIINSKLIDDLKLSLSMYYKYIEKKGLYKKHGEV